MLSENSIIKKDDLKFTFNVFKEVSIPRGDKKINIIVIDDSKKDVELLNDLLLEESDLNFHLESYNHPNEAMSSLSNKSIKPDLIIVDLVMPEMNGNVVLNNLKEIEHIRSVPIIIHSSMNNYENIKKVCGLNEQVVAFFGKPIRVSGFMSLFQKKLKNR
ncbi:MAG: response regulator [Rickettsiales bacterium]|jgi:response regulator RpfG family c-di-GMP phosphodiesterase|nr:response regulator [Rickettsiales bacterium]